MAVRRLPHACGRCDTRWAGEKTCHCGTCHRTFSSWSAFDQHRLGGECQDPATRKLVLRPRAGYEVWGDPGDDDRPGRWDSTTSDRIDAIVASAPRMTAEQADRIRRLFRYGQPESAGLR